MASDGLIDRASVTVGLASDEAAGCARSPLVAALPLVTR